MQKLKILIVDDEPLAQEILLSYIAKIDTLELVGVCKNALEAFGLINKEPIDVLLLDINMPEMNGIDFLKSLKHPPFTIFTTAYSEFAIESYELNIIDYLLKPISIGRFLKAINKVEELLRPIEKKEAITHNLNNHLFVRSDGKWVKIDLAQLWLIEGLKDYVRLWINEERITVHTTMKNFEEQLVSYPHFIRVHKSHIVNLNYVLEVDSNAIKLKSQLITIGSTYKEQVFKTLNSNKLI